MAKRTNSVPVPDDYRMPAVEVGDMVNWHPEQDADPVATAVVTKVGPETVALSVIEHNMYNMLSRDGVRHKDHPDRQIVRSTEEGVWSHLPQTIRLQERLEMLETLLK